MKKILNLMLGFSLVAGGSAGVVACGGNTSTAQNEANKANGQTVGLNETQKGQYDGQTAHYDADAIKNAMAKMPGMGTIVQDFSFANKTDKLKVGHNTVNYNVKAKDGSTASGSFNVNIKVAPKVTPGQTVLTPATSQKTKAQTEANKVNGKTVDLKDFGILGYKIFNYENKTASQDAWIIKADLIKANIISTTEANDFTFNNTTKLKVGDNTVTYNVKASDGSTASGSMDVNIANGASAVNKKVNGKSVNLKDTGILGYKIFNYENKTASQDAYGIKAALYTSKILSWDEVNELSFPDNKTPLKVGENKVAYNIKAKDGSTASGTINVNIENDATAVNNKVNGKTVDVKDLKLFGLFNIYSFENKTAAQDSWIIKADLYKSKILNWNEVNDLTFADNKTKLQKGDNTVAYNIKAPDGSIANGTIDVNIS